MSIESLTYAELGDRLGASPEAARSLARRLRLPRRPGNDDKVRVTVDLGEIQYKPLPARRPARDHRAETDALNARIEQLRAELAKVEVEKRRIEVSAARSPGGLRARARAVQHPHGRGSGPGQACNVCS
jgi:hypothetical protein